MHACTSGSAFVISHRPHVHIKHATAQLNQPAMSARLDALAAGIDLREHLVLIISCDEILIYLPGLVSAFLVRSCVP